jgi:RHS repeat-associated protein
MTDESESSRSERVTNASTVSFQYDKAGRLIAEQGADGRVRYELDELDNLATLHLPHEQRIDFLSYGSGHVHQVRCGEHLIADIERDDLHREVMRTQGRLTLGLNYDALGRRTWQSAATDPNTIGPGQGKLWRTYRYSAQGELAEQTDNTRGALQFEYDPAGQMLRRSKPDGRTDLERFAWDAAGNLLDEIQRKSAGRVEGNRLQMWQDIRFEYDAWGNLKTKLSGHRQTQHFSFDAENRLIGVKTEIRGGRIETTFEYDALGRRVGKSERHIEVSGRISPEQTRRFVWQGLRMVQELRETGLSNYVYSADSPYTPMARVDAYTGPMPVTYEPDSHGAMQPVRAKVRPRVLHFHTDLVGAPMEVTDEVGELAWVGDYTAWGKVKKDTEHAFQARIEQPLRYPGQYEDDSTGLHYNTMRYYDPDVGRFISQDPIGLMGGENLYAYAPNPTGRIDPLGWVNESATGYSVYGLFDKGASQPYYVGVTDDLSRRAGEHIQSGRLGQGTEIRALDRNVTYGQARGYEQAYIEHYQTKTGVIGEEITAANRGNKVASFDHSSQARTPSRQANFEGNYREKMNGLKGGC